MRFHFQLEGVLRVRRQLEEQASQRLEEAMSQLCALERSLAEATEWSRKTAILRSSKKRLPAAEVQFIESVLRQTQEAIADCQRRTQLEEQRANQLRSTYLEARRKRETVSILRQNALRRYQAEQSRRQQFELDEIYLGKLIRLRNAAAQGDSSATLQPDL